MVIGNLKLYTRWLFTNACNTNLEMELRLKMVLASKITIQKIKLIQLFFYMEINQDKMHQENFKYVLLDP
jgi:hypothetical protein